jgi:hypothetical protein
MESKFSHRRWPAEVAAQHHLRAVPPGNDIGVIGWRRIDQKIVARIVQRAGQRLKVEVVSRIGIDLVFDQRVEHGGGHARGVPGMSIVSGCRDRVARLGYLRGRLNGPVGEIGARDADARDVTPLCG